MITSGRGEASFTRAPDGKAEPYRKGGGQAAETVSFGN